MSITMYLIVSTVLKAAIAASLVAIIVTIWRR